MSAKYEARYKRPTGRPAGGPTKLTPQMHKDICNWLRAGNYLNTTARLVGVHMYSIYRWLERGHKEKKGIYRDFLMDVRKAQAEAETKLLSYVNGAGRKDWKAAAWRLERLQPKKYGPARLKVEESDKPLSKVSFDLVMVDKDNDTDS